jgi:uncharacterized membrane protein
VKPQTLLLSTIVICAVIAMAFIGISATVSGDPQPVLLLFIGTVTPVVTAILTLLKSQKTLDATTSNSEKIDAQATKVDQTKRKVDALLNDRVTRVEARLNNLETVALEILEKVSSKT